MTDPQLIRWLAQHAMRWPLYPTSHHRPGTRPAPHAWTWRRGGRVLVMVSDRAGGIAAGGEGGHRWTNAEWNPLSSGADAAALAEAMAARGTPPPPYPTDTADGRRSLCATVVTFLQNETETE